jgi:uncharacterized membrane protein YuzA (DUF378 family)
MAPIIEIVIAIFAGIGALTVFDIIGELFGTDFRSRYRDDRAR